VFYHVVFDNWAKWIQDAASKGKAAFVFLFVESFGKPYLHLYLNAFTMAVSENEDDGRR
jgi:hypothetical protein